MADDIRLILLERQIAFLTDRLSSIESDAGPIYDLLPVRVHDIFPVSNQSADGAELMMVVLHTSTANDGPVIRVSRQTAQALAETPDGQTLTFSDYVLTDRIARRRLKNRRWVWELV